MEPQSHIYDALNSAEWMLLATLLIISFLIGILLMWFIWSGRVKKLQKSIEKAKRNYKSKELEFDRTQKKVEDLEIELEKQEKVKTNTEKELVRLKAEIQIKKNKLDDTQERVKQLKENINAQAVTIETLHNQLLDLKANQKKLSAPPPKIRKQTTKAPTQKSETT
jgi:septal ring factor EnvC (AmiA/AmiB activator)